MSKFRDGTERLGDALLAVFTSDWGSKKKSLIDTIQSTDSGVFQLVSTYQVWFAALLGSLAGMGVIATINIAITSDNAAAYSLKLPIIFIILLLINRIAQLSLLNSCSAAIETALETRRLKSLKKLAEIELLTIEELNKSDISAGLTKHYDIIYNSVLEVISGVRAGALVFFLICYLAYISINAAIVCVITSVIIAASYYSREGELERERASAAKYEVDLISRIDELLGGFKEIKLDQNKKTLLLDGLSNAVSKAAQSRISVSTSLNDLIVFGNVINYLFAGTVVFVLPVLGSIDRVDIAKIMAVVLFLIGPLSTFVDAIQQISLLKFSFNSIKNFEGKIDSLQPMTYTPKNVMLFETLELKDVVFRRKEGSGEKGFCVGPINLTISKGKIHFIEGSNGSGKTTVIRVICGLYPKHSGDIFLNGVKISDSDLGSYRQIFGVIFSDFYLFKNPYGIADSKLDKFHDYLKTLEIDNYVSINPLNLRVDKLSTGQRKRLALALLLTENRPVYIFDEWAADQDPHFRGIFYNKILPDLKREGKAIIAITHDDRFFDLTDYRYHMEDGRFSLVYDDVSQV